MASLRGTRGFTVVEIIIALTIVSLLVVIAVPLYHHQIVKSRRGDAKSAVLHLASSMEKYFIVHHTYATATIGSNPHTDVLDSNRSALGYYTLHILEQSDDRYVIEAKPTAEHAAQDLDCGSFQLNQLGQRSITGWSSAQFCW